MVIMKHNFLVGSSALPVDSWPHSREELQYCYDWYKPLSSGTHDRLDKGEGRSLLHQSKAPG